MLSEQSLEITQNSRFNNMEKKMLNLNFYKDGIISSEFYRCSTFQFVPSYRIQDKGPRRFGLVLSNTLRYRSLSLSPSLSSHSHQEVGS